MHIVNSRSNAHCDGTAMAPLCKMVKRGAVQATDLLLSNDLEAWPDGSVGRALDVQSQGSRARTPLGSVIFSHFHFSFLSHLVAFAKITYSNFSPPPQSIINSPYYTDYEKSCPFQFIDTLS